MEANLTPMIDVTFLLIVFFVLVSQIVEVENVPMELPAPVDPPTEHAGDEQRVVINVIPGPDGRADGWRFGSIVHTPDADGLAQITARLSDAFSANPHVQVNLRADRRTRYEDVEPVMRAVGDAARTAVGGPYDARLNVVVLRENSSG